MFEPKQVMVDLETLGTLADSVILSIGAVVFDPVTGVMGETFYTPISKASQSNRRIMASTLTWWEEQSSGARQALRDAETTTTTLEEALTAFSQWLSKQGDVEVHGNGASFDNAMLQHAYGELGMELPWKFWNDRCYRTLKNLYSYIQMEQRVGTYHNALDDAITQALHAVLLMREHKASTSRLSRIRQWARDRNLIAGASSQAQMVKLMEEIGELAGALARGNREGIVDGIGDAVVVLTILAAQQGLRIEDCIDAAWVEIKDRKGKMVDGIFVKDAE